MKHEAIKTVVAAAVVVVVVVVVVEVVQVVVVVVVVVVVETNNSVPLASPPPAPPLPVTGGGVVSYERKPPKTGGSSLTLHARPLDREPVTAKSFGKTQKTTEPIGEIKCPRCNVRRSSFCPRAAPKPQKDKVKLRLASSAGKKR